MDLYGIFGTGGFAREVMPVCREALSKQYPNGGYELVFVDKEAALPAGDVNGHKVLSEQGYLTYPASRKFFNVAIADSRLREAIANRIDADAAQPFSIFASNFVGLDGNRIGHGGLFCPFSMVTSNVTIGRFFHANFYCCVTHDCVIGDFVTFAPKVQCNGNVIIEDHAYIGAGAIIKNGTPETPLVIGEGAVIGMGAVVTKNVLPFTTVVGNPARPLVR